MSLYLTLAMCLQFEAVMNDLNRKGSVWFSRPARAGEAPAEATGTSGSEIMMGDFEREQRFMLKDFRQKIF